MKDHYQFQRENCPYFKANGVHRVVKGHNTCCCDNNVSVCHPEQPNTQVEKWREEIKENRKAQLEHDNKTSEDVCECEECCEREDKIAQLEGLIKADHEKNKRHLNKFFGGEFADDWNVILCTVEKATLLDKIKRLWKMLKTLLKLSTPYDRL